VRVVKAALLGYGQVGQAVTTLAARPDVRACLRRARIDLRWVSAFVRDVEKPRAGQCVPLTTIASRAIDADVVVELLGGVEPARSLVQAALLARVPVVTANKTLIARHGAELRALADRQRTRLAYDAAVLAGVPFLGSLARRPIVASARRIAGILNGTSHVITTAMERGATLACALDRARRLGYAESDSTADTSGRDAAEKLAILLHTGGTADVAPDDVPRLPLDVLSRELMTGARRLGGAIKPVVLAHLDLPGAGAWVGPAFVPLDHPLARLDGVANILQLTTIAGDVITFAGPGAGPDATALTVLDDVIEVVTQTGGRREPRPVSRTQTDVTRALRTPPACAWLLEIRHERERDPRVVARRLSALSVPPQQIGAHAGAVIARTIPAPWPVVDRVLHSLRANGSTVVALPCPQ
jgi:homoserine dehydrogenase